MLVTIFILIVSLVALVKGADWMLASSEKIGLSVGLSPFIVGVVIVGLGTSYPEFISSVFAVLAGAPDIVPANAVGSNIANIFLVAGVAAIVAGRLSITKSLIDLDIPLLVGATMLFLGVAWDGTITQIESGILFLGFIVYFIYTMTAHEADEPDTGSEVTRVLDTPKTVKLHIVNPFKKMLDMVNGSNGRPKVTWTDGLLLVVGVASLAFGAKFLIDSVIELSKLLNIGQAAIAMFAVAIGTSLPELLVSVKAAWAGKSEVALGNVFGSNVFNLLFVVGVPGLFVTLPLDQSTLELGIPMVILATFFFIISGISRRLHSWEGYMYVLLYVFFIGKLFGFI